MKQNINAKMLDKIPAIIVITIYKSSQENMFLKKRTGRTKPIPQAGSSGYLFQKYAPGYVKDKK